MHVAIICTGNICRSPIGEVILRAAVNASELAGDVVISSAGTARWHVGKEMDPRAAGALRRAGYEADASLGAFADAQYLESVDVAVAMTREHRTDLLARRGDLNVVLVRELLGEGTLDVADPYYGDDADFDETVATMRRATTPVMALLRRMRPSRGA